MRGWMLWVAAIFGLVVAWALLESELRVMLLVLAGAGGYLVVTSGLKMLRQREQPSLVVPAEVRPGESFVVRFGPPAASPQPLRGLRLRLVCRELRRRRVSGRTVTDKHDWVVEEADGPMRGEHEFTVPSDAMHTFGARHHEIAWLVEAQGRAGNLRTGPVAVAPLTVLPERYEP